MPALITGTFAPDFEYFLRFGPRGHFGHTLPGVFVLSLPLTLVMLWLFDRVVKIPLILISPDSIQRRLTIHSDNIHASGHAKFALIAGSALVGIMTHLLWDSLTHPYTWPYYHWSIFSQTLRLPVVGSVPYFRVFQHSSSVLGCCILAAWFAHWRHTTEPGPVLYGGLTPSRKRAIVLIILTVAFFGTSLWMIHENALRKGRIFPEEFVAETVVTFIALIWWQLVVYGLIILKRTRNSHVSQTDTA
jgi:Domain of unknown function (DUF4184)